MKTIIAGLVLLSSISAFATTAKLIPGKEIYVDSGTTNSARILTSSLILETVSADENAVPTYKLVRQWSGFECEHQNTVLVNSEYNTEAKLYKNTWDIQVSYITGSDMSACDITVSFPGMKDSRASIFLNY